MHSVSLWWSGLALLCGVGRAAQRGAPLETGWETDSVAEQREFDARTFASVDYLNPDLEYSDKKLEIKGQQFLTWNELEENITVIGGDGRDAVRHNIQPDDVPAAASAYDHDRTAQLAENLTFTTRVPRTAESDFQRPLSTPCFDCMRYVCENAVSYIRRYSRYCCLKVVQDQYRQEVGCFRRRHADKSGRNMQLCHKHKADWNECVDVVMSSPCLGCATNSSWNTTSSVRRDTHHGRITYDHLPNKVHAHTYVVGDGRVQRGVGIASNVIE